MSPLASKAQERSSEHEKQIRDKIKTAALSLFETQKVDAPISLSMLERSSWSREKYGSHDMFLGIRGSGRTGRGGSFF